MKHTKKRIAACLLLLILGFGSVFAGIGISKPVVVAAEDSVIKTGYISAGVTQVRVRTSIDTSTTANVIAQVNAGFRFDIYGSEYAANGYEWYSVGFTYEGSSRRGYVAAEFVTIDNSGGGSDYTEDTDFEAYLTAQGFPESYKDGLRALHEQYPKWVFVADHNGVDWDTMVTQQSEAGRSLVHRDEPDSWKSTAAGCYDWSTGTYHMYDGYWSQASNEMIEYALDPRNFINATNIFMFESLVYNSSYQNENGVRSFITGSFMDGSSHDLRYNGTEYDYASALMLAGQRAGINPYHLATRIFQEIRRDNPSDIISGSISGYEGFYNYYNISAVNRDGNTATVNGLIYAKDTDDGTLRPWNSRMKAIIGGAIFVGNQYVKIGQNTLYYEKFDVRTFWHQYMTNIRAVISESSALSSAYAADVKSNSAFVFTIPIYDNMPESVCEIPEENYGNVNNKLRDLSVDGYSLTPTFDLYTNEYDLIVDNNISKIHVSGQRVDDYASVDGFGDYSLNVGSNTISIVVTAQSGAKNTYTITVIRQEPDTTGEGTGFTSKYTVDDGNKTISNISVGSTASEFKSGITCTGGTTVKVLDINGSEVTGKVATGNVLTVYNASNSVAAKYDIVIYGDPTGDGEVDLFDIVRIKRYMLGASSLSNSYLEAADCNHDGAVDLFDIVAIKRNMLGKAYITQ